MTCNPEIQFRPGVRSVALPHTYTVACGTNVGLLRACVSDPRECVCGPLTSARAIVYNLAPIQIQFSNTAWNNSSEKVEQLHKEVAAIASCNQKLYWKLCPMVRYNTIHIRIQIKVPENVGQNFNEHRLKRKKPHKIRAVPSAPA